MSPPLSKCLVTSIPLLSFPLSFLLLLCRSRMSTQVSTTWYQNSLLQESYDLNKLWYPKEIKMDDLQLLLMKKPEKRWDSCMGCKERNVRPCYKHEDAKGNHHLHKECYNLLRIEKSSIMFNLGSKKSNCDYIFHKEDLGGKEVCDACGDDVKGWFYSCKTCKKPHYLHPCCAKLPIKKNVDTRNGQIIVYLKSKSPSKCLICGNKQNSEGFRGWYYISSCGKYCYHWSCMKHMALNMWNENDDHHHDKKRRLDTEKRSQALMSTSHKPDTVQQASYKTGKESKTWSAEDGNPDKKLRLVDNQKQRSGDQNKSQAMQPSQPTKKCPLSKAMGFVAEVAIELLNIIIPLIFGLPPIPLGLVLKFLK